MEANRLAEIKQEIEETKRFDGEVIPAPKYTHDVRVCLDHIDQQQAEIERIKSINPEFWELYDRYETKIQEKLALKDQLERLNRAYEVLAKSFEAISPSAYKAAMERIGKDGEQG